MEETQDNTKIVDEIYNYISDHLLIDSKTNVKKEVKKKYENYEKELISAWRKYESNGNGKDKDNDYYTFMYNKALEFVHKYHIHTIEANSLFKEEVWAWYKGCYKRNGEGLINTDMLSKGLSKPQDFRVVIEYIKSITRKPRDEVQQKSYCINLINGILDYTNGDIIFIPRNKKDDFHEYNFINMLPIKYNKDAKCEIIDKVFRKILNDGEFINTIYEFLGMILMTDYRIKSSVFIVGPKNSGKTTLLNPIIQFVGKDYYSSLPLHLLDTSNDKFSGVNLDGKFANICDELAPISPKTYETFKAAVGGGGFWVQKKGRDGYNLRNSAKMVFAANNLFHVNEEIEEGFFERVILITLDTMIENMDTRYKDMIYSEEEMSGLLNHAIDGLKILLKNGKFTYDKSLTEKRWNDYIKSKENSSVYDFENEWIDPDLRVRIPKKLLYSVYCYYCSLYSKKIVSENKFTSTIKNDKSRYETKMPMGDKRHTAWKGISLIKDIENKIEDEKVIIEIKEWRKFAYRDDVDIELDGVKKE